MIRFSEIADGQIAELMRFYESEKRYGALRNLAGALAEASLIIMNAPEKGLPAPRPYPALNRLRLRWLKRGRYWIAYRTDAPVIIYVFFETADIPGRVG